MKIERHYEDFMQKEPIEEGGLIKMSGKFLLDHEEEIVNLIKHEGRIAEERNPLHKVTAIEKANGGMVAKISDHNLALHIGKALFHAYQGTHEFKFLKGEKYVEVLWKRDE